jgi:hypothetical protein
VKQRIALQIRVKIPQFDAGDFAARIGKQVAAQLNARPKLNIPVLPSPPPAPPAPRRLK